MKQQDQFGSLYRPMDDAENRIIYGAREIASDFGDLLDRLEDSREKDLALTRLEEAVMWLTKHVVRHGAPAD
ncbi:hypothetical protein [Cognatishimia sp. F0-27]|uniref:Acb2/Tad1 domain-containing protein n=1 Tax=Cognatishimia sp. F0-27 TaxID=2816855 RepID=UPI001D0C6E59|nr:hypothetical protein [Cognatishimia sp. F0-27]MCC1494480.1 hypothetical protein [Cognatishimia sp. F0-27]